VSHRNDEMLLTSPRGKGGMKRNLNLQVRKEVMRRGFPPSPYNCMRNSHSQSQITAKFTENANLTLNVTLTKVIRIQMLAKRLSAKNEGVIFS
jgi:hypothetical protein